MKTAGTSNDQAPPEGRITLHDHGHILLIQIDRERKRNSFTPTMLGQLADAYTIYEASPDYRCAVLHSAGDHFCSGLDLAEVELDAQLFPDGLIDPVGLHPPLRRKPMIAAVQGVCFTLGIELMLATDIVVAAESTRFSQLEVKRGTIAFCGATLRMPERAGWGNAMRYLLTGDEFDAKEALRLGFVQDITADGNQLQRALELAERVAHQAPLAVTAMRQSAQTAVIHGVDACVRELPSLLSRLTDSEDFKEGVRSFVEHRKGQFVGR